MFQITCKTLSFMKIIDCEIPPEGGAKPYLFHGLKAGDKVDFSKQVERYTYITTNRFIVSSEI